MLFSVLVKPGPVAVSRIADNHLVVAGDSASEKEGWHLSEECSGVNNRLVGVVNPDVDMVTGQGGNVRHEGNVAVVRDQSCRARDDQSHLYLGCCGLARQTGATDTLQMEMTYN